MQFISPYQNNIHFSLPEYKNFQHYDLIIVGAGLAGCSAAYYASQKGLKTLLIDKGVIGSGQTGCSGGQFIPGFETDLTTMFKLYDKETTINLFNHSLSGFQELMSIVGEQFFHSKGFILSTDKNDDDYLREEHEYFNQLGVNTNLIEDYELHKFINSKSYTYGLELSFVKHANPLEICYELLKNSHHEFLDILENSEVLNTSKNEIHLKNKNIKFKHIFLAGGDSITLHHKYFRPTVWVKTYSIATEILTPEEQANLIPMNHCFFDSREATMDYFRINENRLLFGGGDSIASSHERGLAYLNKRFVDVFPSLKDKKIEYSWGQFADVSSSRMPIISQKDNVWVASGYSGQGLINSYCSGKWMIDSLFSQGSQWEELKNIHHLSFPTYKPFTYLSGSLGANVMKIFS